jgi:hypothetical protein
MNDTSRPSPQLNSSFGSNLSQSFSSLFDTRFLLNKKVLVRLNNNTKSSETENDTGTSKVSSKLWGGLRVRAGRGDLVQAGLTRSIRREINLGLALVAIA